MGNFFHAMTKHSKIVTYTNLEYNLMFTETTVLEKVGRLRMFMFAAERLGECYEYGLGVQQSYTESNKWYWKVRENLAK